MRYLFRPNRQDPDSLVETPFHGHKPPLDLSHDKLKACAEKYSLARWEEYIARLDGRQHDRRGKSPKPAQWPDFRCFGLSREDFWKYEIAWGQFVFSDTKQRQQQGKARVNALATRGPRDLRKALAKARRSISQVNRTLSWRNLFCFFDYLARQQFLWIFLRHESQWSKGEPKNGRAFDTTVQTLAKDYSYLNLTPAMIAEGIRDPDNTVKGVAKQFGLSASSVGSLLSKSIRR